MVMLNLKRFSGVAAFILGFTLIKQRMYSNFLLNHDVFGKDGK